MAVSLIVSLSFFEFTQILSLDADIGFKLGWRNDAVGPEALLTPLVQSPMCPLIYGRESAWWLSFELMSAMLCNDVMGASTRKENQMGSSSTPPVTKDHSSHKELSLKASHVNTQCVSLGCSQALSQMLQL